MVVLRCTRKLLRYVGTPQTVSEPSTTILGDWFAQSVSIGHQRFVLLISKRSRLPVLMSGRDLKNLIRNFPDALAQVLDALDVPSAAVTSEVEASREAVISVTNNRSLLGTLNDFSFLLAYELRQKPDTSLLDAALWLSRTPVGPLGSRMPDQVTRDLLGLGA